MNVIKLSLACFVEQFGLFGTYIFDIRRENQNRRYRAVLYLKYFSRY